MKALSECPFCGHIESDVITEYFSRRHCLGCGALGPGGVTYTDADAQWNRRTLAPMTSVVKWHFCTRESQDFPDAGKLVVYEADKYANDSGKKITRLKRYEKSMFDAQVRFGQTVKWFYFPEIPEEQS